MRIASVSDLHTDYPDNRLALVKLATAMHEQGADVIILAGDVSHVDDRITRALTALRAVADNVLFIPGNHDLWSHALKTGEDTWDRYHNHLSRLTDATGAHYLPAGPFVKDGVAFVGTCGWYDYSFAREDLGLSYEDFERKQLGRLSWGDGRAIAFRNKDGGVMSDPDVAARMTGEFSAQLQAMEARDDVEHIVAVTHHQPFEQVVHRSGRLPWEYFCAFMGTGTMGEAILSASKVRVAVYGHTHIPGDTEIEGVRVFGTPLGYPKERRSLSEEEMVRTRIGWIDL